MRRALVTGASGGIGAAVARQLARDGFEVIVHANSNRDKATAIAQEIGAAGGNATVACFDVADNATSRAALELLLGAGPIQVIVNNAGVHDDAPLAGMTPQQWGRVIDVSLNGFFNVTQPLLLPMLRTRWGRIVSMASVAGIIGNRGQTNYAAAKAGLIGASKSLAQEIASRGVTVNVVAPGIIETAMTAQMFPAETIAQMVPMKRAGTAAEVADLVSFLVSERAAYVTSQVVSINGGMI